MSLPEAIAHPRCHAELRDGGVLVSHEPGVNVSRVGWPVRAFDQPHMFFGGVQAAARSATGAMSAAGDPRRNAGAAVAAAR
jgi:gamma-glutamyltranspeptidase/glutathione hydrolase